MSLVLVVLANCGDSAPQSPDADVSAPETTIASAPAELSNDAIATFTLESDDPAATFECSLDGLGFAPCHSTATTPALADGPHGFEVRAVDQHGNVDPSPAMHTWTIDTVPPETTITAGPAPLAPSADAQFVLASSETPGLFECSLDGGAFTACMTPHEIVALADGAHTLSVRAVDLAGNADSSPVAHTWTVDTVAPDTAIDGGPATWSASTSAQLLFSSPDATAAFECRLDAGAFTTCASPHVLATLGEGAHAFEVRAVDPAGHVDTSPAAHAWTIDLTAPDTSITAAPPTHSGSTAAQVTFSSIDPNATFECSVDGAAFVGCTSPHVMTGLVDGPHTFAVRATDLAGNIEPSPAEHAWTVDTVPPDTIITAAPDSLTHEALASFALAGADAFECSLDGGAWVACASAFDLLVTQGQHVLEARGLDLAGNLDPSPAIHVWTYDVDECASGVATCSADARCVDRIGGYGCVGDETPLCFDGVDDRASTDSSDAFATLAAATIELWFRATATGGDYALVDIEADAGGDRRVGLDLTDAATQNFGALSGRVLMVTVDARANGGGLNVRGFDLDATLPGFDETEWHHYAAVLSGTKTRLFVDGIELTTAQQRDGDESATLTDAFGAAFVADGGRTRLHVGWFQRDGIRFTRGFFEDLRISRTARYASAFSPEYPLAADSDAEVAYAFEEGAGSVAHDDGGALLHLDLIGPSWGQCGSSLYFDGSDHAAVAGSQDLDLDGHSYTIEAWMKPTAPSTWLHFAVAKKRRDVNDGWHIVRAGAGCDGISTTAPPPGSTCGFVPVGQWTHVAITYDAITQQKCTWIAGVARACGTTAAHEGVNDELLQFGNEINGYAETHFTGYLDEIRISSAVRYSAVFTPTRRFVDDAATLALWHFDERTGTIAVSAVGPYEATLTGPTWVDDAP